MPYYSIEHFSAGMDVRKSAATAPAGTLRLLKNAVVNPGGEIEKRQAFVFFDDVPSNTVGLMRMGDNLWTIGAGGAVIPPTLNADGTGTVGYYPLAPPAAGLYPLELMDYTQYGTRFYVIAYWSNGGIYHHFDGAWVPTATGTACVTVNKKVYVVDGRYLRACVTGNPADWNPVGDGYFEADLASTDAEMLDNRGLEVYYDKIAVFSQRAAQIWVVKTEIEGNTLLQTLRQAGAVSAKSIRQYGSGDILYLSQDGIRSLKAREQTITASVSDIGSPMDPYVLTLGNTLGVATMNRTNALLEPTNGRYWFILPNEILVLSNYPSPKIAAWSTFTPAGSRTPGGVSAPFWITDAATAGPWIYVRDYNHQVWRYGAGLNTPVYDDTVAEITMPYLHFDKPATFKQFEGVDLACQGTWNLSAGFNPNAPAAEDFLGTVNGSTFLDGHFPMMGHSTHCSLRFKSAGPPAAAVLSGVMIHYKETTTG